MRWTDDVTRTRLANGLTVLAQRRAAAPVVAVTVYVKAGYFDEPDEWVGISHVLEHMYFKGSDSVGPGAIARRIKSLGGYINAGTIYDRTSYYVVLPSEGDSWRTAMAIQARALTELRFDPDELAAELEVIVQEANRKRDDPGALSRETLYELLFPDHPMGRWRIGTEDGLRRLGAADLDAYYHSRYRPDSTIVAVVGDVSTAEAVDEAASLFGDWRGEQSGITVPPHPRTTVDPALRRLSRDVTRAIAVLGWKTVPESDPEAPALDMAAALLGSGRGASLYRGLRSPGLAGSASASHYTPTITGVFDITLRAEPHRVQPAVATALGAVSDLIESGPSSHDLQRARSLVATRRARALESMEVRAATLCHYEALGDYVMADTSWSAVMAVEGEQVRVAASRFLAPSRVSGVLCLPLESESSIGGWPTAPVSPNLASVEVAGAPGEDRQVDLAVRETVEGGAATTIGGTDFLFLPKPGSGLCCVGSYFQGLPARETREQAGVSALLTRASIRGIRGYDGGELALAVESLGGSLAPVCVKDYAGWSVTVGAEHVAGAAGFLGALSNSAAFDPTQVEHERGLQAADARAARDDMFAYPIRRAIMAAFPGTGYGIPTLGDPETVVDLDEGDLHHWSRRAACGPTAVIAVGDLDPEAALNSIVRRWDWPATVPGDDGPLAVWNPGAGAESRGKEQTALAMAFPAPSFESDDRAAIGVLCSILGGMGGRLFRALREERSLAYTVSVLPWLQRRAGAVATYIGVDPEREDEARRETLLQLEEVVQQGVSEDELRNARAYLCGVERMKRETSSSVLAGMAKQLSCGRVEPLRKILDDLRDVSRDDVLRVARDVFVADRRSEYVIRGGSG